MNIVSENTLVKISQQELNLGKNLDEKLKKATQLGFFYLEMPEECKKLQHFAVEFGNKFFTFPHIQNLQLEMPNGFRVQNHTQNQRLILENKYWDQYFSPEVALLAKKMHEIGTKVLNETLRVCDVLESDRDLATGGAANEKGQTFFTFNHYTPSREVEGLYPHRDFGQITVLFINQKGLQAKINDQYVDVNPLEDHFIINFGRALETYINNPEELTAAWHRVQQVSKDRISFGIFMDNHFALPIYKREGSSNSIVEPTFGEYLKKLFAEAHQDQSA